MPLCAITAREILEETALGTRNGAGTCVGRPLDGTQMKVIRFSDDAIPKWDPSLELESGQVGELVVSGPHVTRRYFENQEATRLAKSWKHDPTARRSYGTAWATSDASTKRAGFGFSVARSTSCAKVVRPTTQCVSKAYSTRSRTCVALPSSDTTGSGARNWCSSSSSTRTQRPRAKDVRRDELLAIAQTRGIPLTRVVFRRKPLPTDRRHNSKIERIALTSFSQKKYG